MACAAAMCGAIAARHERGWVARHAAGRAVVFETLERALEWCEEGLLLLQLDAQPVQLPSAAAWPRARVRACVRVRACARACGRV